MINRLNIGIRLGLGFLLIQLVFISLTLFAISKMNLLSEQTVNIYNHPLAVSNAVLRINANIIKMHRTMKDIALSESEENLIEDSEAVDELERTVLRDFEIIDKQFLGEKEKYENALEVFSSWKPVRDEVISLMRKGERKKAAAITKGKGALHVERIEESIEALGDFAQNKARDFLRVAHQTRDFSLRIIYFSLVISVLVTLAFAIYLTRSITGPVRLMKDFTGRIGSGDFEARLTIDSMDELGELASSFNKMTSDLNEIAASRDSLNREIVERTKAEKRLVQSESLLLKIAENYPNAYLSVIEKDLTVGFTSGQEFKNVNLDPKSFEGLTIEEVFGEHTPLVRERYLRAFQGEQNSFELFIDGQYQLYNAVPIYEESGEVLRILSVVENITGRRRMEEALRQSLQDKDMLIKEIHHRVKNNLMVIQSLLRLQLKDIDDEQSKAFFVEAQDRVRAMSMIHERLYRSEDLSSVDSSEYIKSLVNSLLDNYSTSSGTLRHRYDIEDTTLDVDTVIPIGLIINELVSNALKHAFPGGGDGELCISLKKAGEAEYELIVKDSGAGLPEDFNLEDAQTLGLSIVRSLVGQINGSIEIVRGKGAEFRIAFADRPTQHRTPV